MDIMNNPFLAGPVISPAEFVGRGKEIRRIVGRIANRGQSVALSAEPRAGKSSLLGYLAAPETRAALYGADAARYIFACMDTSVFNAGFTPAQFWSLALAPLAEKLAKQPQPELAAVYRTSKAEGFGVSTLEKIFARLQAAGLRLVLLLDEFDTLLNHPVLNKSEFYSGLRSLASRYESLTLVIASRQPLEELNASTQQFSLMGSPYFNFMSQITLGALTDKEAADLLRRADCFSAEDRGYLLFVAGTHPYLLQSAASALWEAYADDEVERQTRWEITARELLETVRPTLADTWRAWSPATRKALTIVALDNLPRLLAGKEFDMDALLTAFSLYGAEVEALAKRGFLTAESASRTGYRLSAQVCYWWLAAELTRSLRPQEGEEDLGSWLRAQQWDGLIKGEEKTQLKRALTALTALLKTGAETLIKTAVETYIKGLAAGK
ncbi:MAG: hypothetical protein OHK0031_15390 [Anaerolineales bacterium]